MLTGATIFSGFEGVGVGMRMAGITHAWGIEYDDQIAGIARQNGFNVITADVLDVDPAGMERVDVLHASPPCPNFSLAKTGGKETAHDIKLAQQVADYLRALRPRYFTLENVWLYRNSQSWREIENALAELGYWGVVQKLDAADFGVSQNRIRMIARFALGEMVAPLTSTVTRWTGWYEAIEDLIPTLPETQFAPWQLKKMLETIKTILIGNSLSGSGFTNLNIAESSDPAFSITTQMGRAKAYLVDGDNARPDTGEPTVREAGQPSMTIRAQRQPTHRAWLAQGKVVKITPRCLARFQSFPDSYELPEKSGLACKGIGNAVPPKLAQAIYAAMAAKESEA